MFDWLVLLQEVPQSDLADHAASHEERQATYQAGISRTAAFQHQLQDWLAQQGVLAQVEAIGEPTAFPVVALRCTPTVAKMIESRAEVKSVLRDRASMALIS
jgi:hypothetical protein